MSRLIRNNVPGIDPSAFDARVRRELGTAVAHPTIPKPALESPTPPQERSPPPADATGSSPDGAPRPETFVRKVAKWAKRMELRADARLHQRHSLLKAEVAGLRVELHSLTALHHRLAEQTERAEAQAVAQAVAQAETQAETNRTVAMLQADLQFQQRRLARLSDGVSPHAAVEPSAAPDAEAIDSLYLAFEEKFRGPWAEIKERLRPHLERLRKLQPVLPGKPLVDIGCGRGEWLELLSEAGIEAYGVDSNPHTVDACARRGLNARHADAFAHLATLPDEMLGAITIFHVIEHLPTNLLLRLLDEARRTLRPGGVLMLETPNPENLKVGACTFYYDPTHLRPIPPLLGTFLVESRGFIDVQVVRLNPYPDTAIIIEETEAAKRINELMYGPQDYALIARRA